MITAIIIDDELKGRIALRQKISSYCPDVILLGEASDGEEGIQLIEQVQPEVVFLDIEMPRLNGFDMLELLVRKQFNLIFTTAYDHYAIKAIRYAAFDYLLKPVDIEELRAAIDRIAEGKINSSTQERLMALQHNLEHKNLHNKIAISDKSGMHLYDINEIVRVEAHSNYSVLFFNNGTKLTASRTLKEFEELLPSDLFFRLHHSHLINIHYVKRYIKGDGGQVEMKNGTFIDVSRRRKDGLMKFLKF
ncbi:two component transcriptional regulator, LytTR family [Chitinophaga costaii]|uniref:Two component transcriptional regulator, LytTR family n=1 Tax=Chitinophaga costaii TaxID=1335309 RepID=A0A1C4FNI7_9BACT|nr:LytTR family DNA-binding domain-containing protein [Chitinophaga costaii]PUZ29941.1 DNA-binding response regulator [Chitinophaga costaii]SCC57091.1 two component transcriptional regulator, LytTR family [Chitinophaga costaii]